MQLFFPIFWNNLSMNNFGKKLKELRTELGIGQISLSNSLGVSKSIISDWELGKSEPTLSKLVAIAKFFSVSIDYLAGIEDE